MPISDVTCALYVVEDLLSYILHLYGFTWLPPANHSHEALRRELSQYVFLPHLGHLLLVTGHAYEEELNEGVHDIFMHVMNQPVNERNSVLLFDILYLLPCDFETDEWIYDLLLYMAVIVDLSVHFFRSGRLVLFSTALLAMAIILSGRIPGGFLACLTAIRNFVRTTILGEN